MKDAGEIKRYAIIINGDDSDNDGRHLENVERSLNILNDQKYETCVLSAKEPVQNNTAYYTASIDQLGELVESLNKKIDSNDELVIYTTGHGAKDGDESEICLKDSCYGEEAAELLDNIVYGKRTVIMDQCYSGGWAKTFLDDPKTLFISGGSENETTCCQFFAPKFWSTEVKDLNSDGVISWQERFSFVMDHTQAAVPKMMVSAGYVMPGSQSFSNEVIEFNNRADFQKELRQLGSGQYAIVTFSMVGCGPCKKYKPYFDDLAKNGAGQHLFLRTRNTDLAGEYGITRFPSVVVFNDLQHYRVVDEIQDPIKTIASFHLTDKERVALRIRTIEFERDEDKKIALIQKISKELSKDKDKDHNANFDYLVVLADSIEDHEKRVQALVCVAEALSEYLPSESLCDFSGKTDSSSDNRPNRIIRMALEAAELITVPKEQAIALIDIASVSYKLDSDFAMSLYHRTEIKADLIESVDVRIEVLTYLIIAATEKDQRDLTEPFINKVIALINTTPSTYQRVEQKMTFACLLGRFDYVDKAKSLFKDAGQEIKNVSSGENQTKLIKEVLYSAFLSSILSESDIINSQLYGILPWYGTLGEFVETIEPVAREIADLEQKVYGMGHVSDFWYSLGEKSRAEELLSEALELADGFTTDKQKAKVLIAITRYSRCFDEDMRDSVINKTKQAIEAVRDPVLQAELRDEFLDNTRKVEGFDKSLNNAIDKVASLPFAYQRLNCYVRLLHTNLYSKLEEKVKAGYHRYITKLMQKHASGEPLINGLFSAVEIAHEMQDKELIQEGLKTIEELIKETKNPVTRCSMMILLSHKYKKMLYMPDKADEILDAIEKQIDETKDQFNQAKMMTMYAGYLSKSELDSKISKADLVFKDALQKINEIWPVSKRIKVALQYFEEALPAKRIEDCIELIEALLLDIPFIDSKEQKASCLLGVADMIDQLEDKEIKTTLLFQWRNIADQISNNDLRKELFQSAGVEEE